MMDKPKGISDLKMFKIRETLRDFKCLLTRYDELKSDEKLVEEFCKRNRNPVFDITTIKYFKTGLKSDLLIENGGDSTDEHFIQRSKAMKVIFDRLSENPNMDDGEFITILKKYCSTVLISKEEHKLLNSTMRGKNKFNYEVYPEIGINVKGIEEYI